VAKIVGREQSPNFINHPFLTWSINNAIDPISIVSIKVELQVNAEEEISGAMI
jgi:hypothetical protein